MHVSHYLLLGFFSGPVASPPPPAPAPAERPQQFFWTGADIARMREKSRREEEARVQAYLRNEADIDEEAIGVLIAAIH